MSIVITVEGLGKMYRIGGPQAGYSTFRETLTDAFTAPFRRAGRLLRGEGSASDLDRTIWALKDVSFEVKRGEVVGIIGRNGAGKSTLLKILSRITEPTEGAADIHGRVGSLLEVGTGFHPELTGRENIYLNGAILGMRRAEIDRKLGEIVAFAEIETFLDTPVKHYSSGMYVRLAFAVAAHLEPEILLVDEVLAVGDAAFQRKCLGKISDVAEGGRTVIFVSHNMTAMNRLCGRVILLEKGGTKLVGDPSKVISAYLSEKATASGQRRWEAGLSNQDVSDFRIIAVRTKSSLGLITSCIPADSSSTVEIEYEIDRGLPRCRVGFAIQGLDGTVIFQSYDADLPEFDQPRGPGKYVSKCQIPPHLLGPGEYRLHINAGVFGRRNLARSENALPLTVQDQGAIGSHFPERRAGFLRPALDWSVERT
jgi:lipopolysaccharide transport system ATP-binding protein